MGSNNNKNQQKPLGNDPKGATQNYIQQQTDRFNQQQGPMANQMAYNYGRGSEANYGDYTDIMNQYRNIASGDVSGDYSGSGGGGAGGGVSAHLVTPGSVGVERVSARQLNPLERVNVADPYNSYAGFQDFSTTGGFSGSDIANMRARGVAPIRAAYANAERNVGQQRSLQGGYSPNAIAAQVKMAREQGQGMSDAAQGVEAELAKQRQSGKLSGLQGMSDIESHRYQNLIDQAKFNSEQSRLGNQFDISNDLTAATTNAGNALDAGKFNVGLDYQGQTYNADAMTRADAANASAAASAAAGRAAGNAQNMDDRFRALSGMTSLYGATPGMANTFGNQLLTSTGQAGNFGQGMAGQFGQSQQLPGQFEQTAGRINTGLDMFNSGMTVANAFLRNNRNQPQTNTGQSTNMVQPGNSGIMGGYQFPTNTGYAPSVVRPTYDPRNPQNIRF